MKNENDCDGSRGSATEPISVRSARRREESRPADAPTAAALRIASARWPGPGAPNRVRRSERIDSAGDGPLASEAARRTGSGRQRWLPAAHAANAERCRLRRRRPAAVLRVAIETASTDHRSALNVFMCRSCRSSSKHLRLHVYVLFSPFLLRFQSFLVSFSVNPFLDISFASVFRGDVTFCYWFYRFVLSFVGLFTYIQFAFIIRHSICSKQAPRQADQPNHRIVSGALTAGSFPLEYGRRCERNRSTQISKYSISHTHFSLFRIDSISHCTDAAEDGKENKQKPDKIKQFVCRHLCCVLLLPLVSLDIVLVIEYRRSFSAAAAAASTVKGEYAFLCLSQLLRFAHGSIPTWDGRSRRRIHLN